MEYGFQCDGQWMPDPCARMVTGREKWGTFPGPGSRCGPRLLTGEFDWEDDVRPETHILTASSTGSMCGDSQSIDPPV